MFLALLFLLAGLQDPSPDSFAEEDLTIAPEDVEMLIAVVEEDYGGSDAELGGALGIIADFLADEGLLDDAERCYQRALDLRVSAHGPNHLKVSVTLNNYALLESSRHNFAAAEALHRRSLAIRESVLGNEHEEVATSLYNLAFLLREQGRPLEALPLCKRAVGIRERKFGAGHTKVARVLSELGLSLRDLGRLPEALRAFTRALAIEESRAEADPRTLSVLLVNLAVVLDNVGRLAEAEELYERALALEEDALGAEHPDLGITLSNLAALYSQQGRYLEAVSLLERSVTILEKASGPEDPDLAVSLLNLAATKEELGEVERALELYQRALAISETALGEGHPQVAGVLVNMAQGLRADGRNEHAEQALRRAIGIYEQAFGSEHPHVAWGVGLLGKHFMVVGEPRKAEHLLARSLALYRSTLGDQHPETLDSQLTLAKFWRNEQDFERAAGLMADALRGVLAHLERELPLMSESDRLQMIREAPGPGRLLMTAHAAGLPFDAELYELCAAFKGAATRLQRAGLQVMQREEQPEVLRDLSRLRVLQADLSEALFASTAERTESHKEHLAQLRKERLQLERKLNRVLGTHEFLERVSHAELVARLPEGAVVVDFYCDEHVFAWVLDRGGAIHFFDLGPTDELAALQRTFLETAVRRGGQAANARVAAGADLYERLWAPLADELEGASTLLVVPDAFLCKLPFGLLPRPEGGFLLESSVFAYLGDVTQGMDRGPERDARAGSMLAIGDVDYYQADSQESAAARQLRAGHRWESLPATRREVQAIRDLFERAAQWEQPFEVLAGAAATESRVRQSLAGRRYLHVATHGFLEPDHLPSLSLSMAAEASAGSLKEERLSAKILPSLLSGLVLAGVNAWPEPGRDDGYLSAEEIQYLDLSACDLAVLSACETALGSLQTGEGLMSLRRAFEVAGAKTVVSSLWKVDDAATATFMKHFYENYWLKGMGKAEALHQAKLRMLRQNRADFGGNAGPETWGAFVLSGDWR